ncbi:hypothetical protein J5N97_002473 [Dioscorea zingiberensis]|uniref:Legume lectin domain-containing protein n=1 Tax=Dioscorea zingiberensis TaxID=325984 RepID=A0A9D5D4D4_9LILI|nr:hypothetical protein J5N97_002473 [Dioscorea zingiberensis]
MALSRIVCRYLPFLLAVFFFYFAFLSLAAAPPFSFSFEGFHEINGTWDSEISLSGDAHSVGSFIEMAAARVVYAKPIKFLGKSPGFSTNFTFSFPPAYAYGGRNLAFFVTPSRVPDGPVDGGNGDALLLAALTVTFQMLPLNPKSQYCVRIAVASETYTESTHLSEANLVLDDVGEKLQSWIDYYGDSKKVHVRVAKSGALRPANSSISYPIDLSDSLQRDAMSVGIVNNINSSAVSRGSILPTCLYSWSFTSRHGAPYMMHSEPLNPQSVRVWPKDGDGTPIQLRRTASSPWRLLMALVFTCAFGALVVLILILMRSASSAIVDKRQVAPVEDVVHSVEFGYEKMVVLEDAKGVKGGEDVVHSK